MKIVETTFERLPRERLEIGFEGENQRATVRIDCASVFAEYPNATPALIVKPLFADAYPVVVDRNGTDVDWLITSEILSFNGDGEIQLIFYKDQVICKSAVSKIRVSRSLTVTGDMPDPVVQWIENANRKLAEVDAQIVELEGMVDTATDAATRAQQSESNATTAAANAATSAATASTKAAEAQASANTATAKASEAALSATQARNSAMSAANSESGATAKAAEAAQSAQTAAQKAEQITEAAQIATGKAEEASASATAAHASATDAASSATAASASETAAKASETAASTSASQAAQSAQTANTAAQTATQKAAESSQSASNAATYATNAATSAETASTKAGEAAQSAQAVTETAEQLAESLEQIDQNTQDIAELDERKANIDGYYPDMTVGNAEQLNSSKFVENSEPYTFRTSGGTSDIGNREYLDAVVGGTVAWNQMVRDEASENSTDFAPIVTVTDAVEDAAGVKVKIEPVQDLHGYENPWPGGGGKNLFDIDGYLSDRSASYTKSGDTYTITVATSLFVDQYVFSDTDEQVTISFDSLANVTTTNVRIDMIDTNGGTVKAIYPNTGTQTVTASKMRFNWSSQGDFTISRLQIEKGSTATAYEPYSNICPITGWDGVKVTRTGKNLAHLTYAVGSSASYTGLTDNAVTVYSNTSSAVYRYARFELAELDAFRGKTVNFSCNITNDAGDATPRTILRITDADYNLVGSNLFELTTLTISRSFTIPSNLADGCKLVAVLYSASNDTGEQRKTWSDIQLELGSTAYEPYAGQTYSITLPTEAGTVYGGELTVNADGSGSLVVDRVSATITSESNIINLSGTLHVGFYELPIAGVTDSEIADRLKHVTKSWAAFKPGDCEVYQNRFNFGYPSDYECNAASAKRYLSEIGGVQFVYKLATPITYTLTASQIRTLLGTNNVWSDAGQIALTYTGTDEHLTLESGKKYLARLSGTDSMLLGSGQEITAAKGTDNVFDLTKMFGTAVADYVYGQGAAFFRKWFPNAVYPYNVGELKHVEGLQSHDMVGFNAWDEEWEQGGFDSDGQEVTFATRIRTKNYIPVIPNAIYYTCIGNNYGANSLGTVCCYDANKNFLRTLYPNANLPIAIPNDTHFIRIGFYVDYGSTYKHDICISLVHNGSRNGEYEPYEKHSYPLDSTVILRGIPKVGSNGVYWDGDRYLPDGTIERRYGVLVCDGTVNYNTPSIVGNYSRIQVNFVNGAGKLTYPQAIASWLDRIVSYSLESNHFYCNDLGAVIIVETSIIGSTAESVRAFFAAHPLEIVYELATPTTETAQPYHSTQWVSDWGTEEFVSTSIVPVGSETRYPANLRDKLQHLPDAASGNGSYLITQTDGQMVLTPFPAPPSTAGNYVLKATVTGGVATYTWEVAT